VCSRRLLAGTLAVIGLAVSCSRETTQVQTVAILPFENLAAAPELDWLSRGLAEALRLQLSGAPRIDAVLVQARRDVASAGATQMIEGYFSVRGGRLEVHAVVEDAARVRTVKTAEANGAASGNALLLARSLAQAIEPGARPLPTNNVEAFRAYVAGLEASDPAEADRDLERAVAADPDFGAAYVAWVQTLVRRGDRARATQVLAGARGRFQNLERVQLDVVAAALSGDPAAERRALMALHQAEPADAAVLRRLGDLDAAAHSYRSAASFYEQASARQPNDVALLNQLGYLRAWAGNLNGAVEALSRYRDLRPREANPLDSLGDVYYYFGRFREAAEAYRRAGAADASFLGGGEPYKRAWALLIEGDTAAATQSFERFLELRRKAGDPMTEFRAAQWEYLTGRRKQGIMRLEQAAANSAPAASAFAYSQLAIWALDAGDRQRASEYAARAPGTAPFAALSRLLAEPVAPAAEWRARAERTFPGPAQGAVRRIALAYALIFSNDFAAAVAPLEEVFAAVQPSAPEWPAIPLAWALMEAGKFERVPELLSKNQAPDPTSEHLLLSLDFPRVLYLRGVLAQRRGQTQEAKADYSLFLKYAGDLPSAFGESDRAKAALARL
jgi:tetratricopeptide (TPR) repeat protein